MIISPHIFSKIKRQSFFSDAAFSCKPSFQIPPKSLKPIYVLALTITIFIFAMFHYSVYIAFSSNASITFPGIRADYGTTSNPLTYKGKQRFGFGIWNHLSPYFTFSAQDTKHRSFLSASSSRGLYCLLTSPFVSPLAAY